MQARSMGPNPLKLCEELLANGVDLKAVQNRMRTCELRRIATTRRITVFLACR